MAGSAEPLLTAEDVARTYSSDPNPVQTLGQFRKAHELRSNHPDWPRAKIARDVGRPPSAVRRWLVDGSKPRVVQAIDNAKERNWLPLYADDRVFPAFNHLVAWIFAGGSISADVFRPTFSIDHRLHRPLLSQAFATLGLDCNTVRHEEKTETLDISLEARPEPGPLLGRVLHALGAPVGVKAKQDLSLPDYLHSISPSQRRAFARVYAINRGSIANPSGAGFAIVTRRQTAFFQELQDFFRDVTGESVSIYRSSRLYLSEAAVQALGGSRSDPKGGLAQRIAYAEDGGLVTEQALANTYRGSYRNPWTIVQQYRAVKRRLDAAADPESLSASEMARDVGGDNRRIYHWMKKSKAKPYAVNGLETAAEKGWLNIDFDAPVFTHLNKLMAWILAAGYIDRSTMYPRFVIQGTPYREVLDSIFNGIDMEFQEESPGINVGTGIDPSHPQASPRSDGAVLGRVLTVLGAPWGPLSKGLPALPVYLAVAPTDIQRSYAQVLVFNRWVKTSDPSTITISIPGEMRGLQTAIHQFLLELVGSPLQQGNSTIRLPKTSVMDLFPDLASPTMEDVGAYLRNG